MEVAFGVHAIELPLGPRISRVYLFVGSERSLLFDVGCDGDVAAHVIPYLESIAVPVQQVEWAVVSHCDVDHFGGLGGCRELLPYARRTAHKLDAAVMESMDEYLNLRAREFRAPHGIDEPPAVVDWLMSVGRPARIDLQIVGGEVIDLGDRSVEILHVPGHSRGHLAVRDRESGVLSISDAALGSAVPLADGSPSFPPTYRYVEEYLETCRMLKELAFESLLTAHYPFFDAATGREFLDESIDFANRLDDVVMDTLADAPMSLVDLVASVNERVGEWPKEGVLPALAQPVMGHVEYGIGLGRVVGVDGAVPMYRTAS